MTLAHEYNFPIKSVLIIGGTGFLGLHLIEKYYTMDKDYPEMNQVRPQIHVFDIRPLPQKISTQFQFDPKEINIIQGDLTNKEDLTRAVKETEPNVVVHAASPIHGAAPDVYEKVNVIGTKNIIDVCNENPLISVLIYTSSAGVAFNGNDLHNADETWPIPKPAMDAYNKTKAIAEQMILDSNNPSNHFYTVSLRPAGIFGPGDRQLVPGLRTVAKLGQDKFQLGDNNNLFDWTYAGNVADAHVLATIALRDHDRVGQVMGQTFFITNDSPSYFWSLARTVWKQDGYPVDEKRVIVLNKTLAMVLAYCSQWMSGLLGKEPGLTPFRVRIVCATRYHNITKAKTLLGYKPRIDIEEGINRTLRWMDEAE